MFRLLLIGFLAYLGFRFYKNYLAPAPKKQDVRGRNKNAPLDLKNSDIQDAHFEDIPENEE